MFFKKKKKNENQCSGCAGHAPTGADKETKRIPVLLTDVYGEKYRVEMSIPPGANFEQFLLNIMQEGILHTFAGKDKIVRLNKIEWGNQLESPREEADDLPKTDEVEN